LIPVAMLARESRECAGATATRGLAIDAGGAVAAIGGRARNAA